MISAAPSLLSLSVVWSADLQEKAIVISDSLLADASGIRKDARSCYRIKALVT